MDASQHSFKSRENIFVSENSLHNIARVSLSFLERILDDGTHKEVILKMLLKIINYRLLYMKMVSLGNIYIGLLIPRQASLIKIHGAIEIVAQSFQRC